MGGSVGRNTLREQILLTRDDVQDTMQRVALAALMYYPEVHVDEPDYQIYGDIDWCIEPLEELPDVERMELREVIGYTITNPTEHRQTLFRLLTELTSEDPKAE